MDIAGVIFGAVAMAVAVLTFVVLFLKGAFNVEHRLTTLEVRIEPFWQALNGVVADNLMANVRPRGNPITPERWDELLKRLKANTLSHSQAEELNEAMLEQQDEAKTKNDNMTILVLGLGLALLAVLLSSKK